MGDVEKIQPDPQVTTDSEWVEPKLDDSHKDVAGQLFEQSLQYDTNQLDKDARKVRMKLDFIALPLV